MVMKQGTNSNTITIPGKGTTTVTAGSVGLGQKATFDLTHLTSSDPSGGVGGSFGYVKELEIRFDGNLKNGNSASRTVVYEMLYDALVETLRLNANGHLFYDLKDAAGTDLLHIDVIETGRGPRWNSSYVTPGSGTDSGLLAFTFSFVLRMYKGKFKKPTDFLIPIKLLQKAILEVTPWGTGRLGADVSVDSFTMTLQARVVERDHYRQPALWTWKENQQSSNDDLIEPAGVMFQEIHMIALQSAGLTNTTFDTDQTDANDFVLKVDNQVIVDTIDGKTLIAFDDAENPLEAGAVLPDPTVGTTRYPLFSQGRADGQITKGIYADNSPRLTFSGDANPATDYRVLVLFQMPQTTTAWAQNASRSGVKVPPGSQVRADTEDKVPVQKGKEAHATFLSAVLVPPATAAKG